MNQRPTEDKPGPDEWDPQLGPDQSRRRMLRRSLTVAAPVVATLTSLPVSAGDCMSASAFFSGNTSRTPMNACTGRSPAAWIALDAASWTAIGVTKGAGNSGTKFDDIFGSDVSGNQSLLTVLGTYDSTPANAVQQAGAVVAVWLNAKAGLTGSVFTTVGTNEPSVLEIWESIVANFGSYRISGTKLMSPQHTHDWLALTWSASAAPIAPRA